MSLNASGTDGLRLFSGDAVELDIRVARLGSRALARLVDLVAQIMLTVALEVVLAIGLEAAQPLADGALGNALAIVVAVIAWVGYPTVLETLAGGRTLGKLVMGLRVIRDDGGPVRFRHAFTRALVGVAVEFPAIGTVVLEPLGWLVSIWTMLVNPLGKRLGDLAAGTVVIHDRTPATWGWVPAMPPHLAGWAATLDLTGLDDDLALAVRHYLARNREIHEPARGRLGYALAAEVATYTTPQPPAGTPGWAYLAAVLAERNRRSAYRLARARSITDRIWPELSHAMHVTAGPPIGAIRPPTPSGLVQPAMAPPPVGFGQPVPVPGPAPAGVPSGQDPGPIRSPAPPS